VTQLEASLETTRSSLDQEGKMLRVREDAAKAQVEEIESQLTQLQSSMDVESKNALQVLRERLSDAESKLSQETKFKAQSETAAQEQIKELLQQVNDAKSIADSATAEKQHLDTQLKQTLAELEQIRVDLESKISRLEQNSEAALADVSMLKKELNDASDSLEREKVSRLDSESEGKTAVEKLEQELTAARQDREEELAAKEQRISKAHEEIEKLNRSLEEALGDAQSAHKTGDAIRKVTQHLKSRINKLESQVEELESGEPEQAAESFELSDDVDFSLEEFHEDEEVPEFDVEQDDIASDDEDQLELQIEEPATAEEPPEHDEPLASNEFAPSTHADPAAPMAFEETPEGPDEDDEPESDFQFDDKPIRSSTPVNNPVLHSMIERFVDRLLEHISSMEEALAKRDYLELVVSCNWVRGEANTLGFKILITPIDAIEYQLRKNKFSQIITHLSELRNMAERIEIVHTSAPDAPIQYIVPAHAKSSIIYENYISQLGSKLLELEIAAHAENSRQMTQLCRWIDRYGEKIKFLEVLDASSQLQEAIETGDSGLIERQLHEFIELYGKIEIIKEGVHA
jgi:chromosome segregation ATPase